MKNTFLLRLLLSVLFASIIVILFYGYDITAKKKPTQIANPASQFCGSSTKGKCATNTDCIVGGCSGQVCQSSSEESIISTCEYQDCYDAEKFGLTCQCSNQQCQWTK